MVSSTGELTILPLALAAPSCRLCEFGIVEACVRRLLPLVCEWDFCFPLGLKGLVDLKIVFVLQQILI